MELDEGRLRGMKRAMLDYERERKQEPPASFPASTTLGRYHLREVLGQGSAAVVYRAVDSELGRMVALKVLRDPVGASNEVGARFRQEARIAAGLNHPNLVALFDAGEIDGKHFVAMELVEGGSLGEALAQNRGDVGHCVRLMERVAAGVAAAHAGGIVHRDLKPGNILVTADGVPKVGDFGLAHIVGSDAHMTRSGAVLGTPLYMAPEQVRGRSGEIDARTDVYALGAVLYEMLTGRPPHPGESMTEIFGRIVSEEPMGPRRLNPQVPPDLETIVLKALEKEPSGRYPSAQEFGDDLRRFLAGDLILAKAAGWMARTRKWLRRRKAAVVAVLLASGVAVAVSGYWWRRMSGVEADRRRLEEERLRGQEAGRLLDLARRSLEAAHQGTFRTGASAAEIRRIAGEGRRLVQEAAGLAPGSADVHFLLGRASTLLEEGPDAIAAYRETVRIDPRHAVAWVELGRALLGQAHMEAWKIGPADEARVRQESAVGSLTREGEAAMATALSLGLEDPVRLESARAYPLIVAGERKAAMEILEPAIREQAQAEGLEELLFLAALAAPMIRERLDYLSKAIDRRPMFLKALYGRAHIHRALNDRPAALVDFNRILEIHPRFVHGISDRGLLHGEMKRDDLALADYNRGIGIDPGHLALRLNRFHLHLDRGEFDAAVLDSKEALRIAPESGPAHGTVGFLHLSKAEYPPALEAFDRAIRLDPRDAVSYQGRARANALLGKWEAAILDFDETLRLDSRSDSALTGRGNVRLARSRESGKGIPAEDVAKIRKDFDDAIRLNPRSPEARLGRGRLFLILRRGTEAREDLETALAEAPAGWSLRSEAATLLEQAKRGAADE